MSAPTYCDVTQLLAHLADAEDCEAGEATLRSSDVRRLLAAGDPRCSATFNSALSVPAAEADIAPPAYLALDVWQAFGLPVEKFDGYYRRNGFADTWSGLMGAIRGPETCGRDTDGEPCVLAPHSDSTPCYGASDVGSSEPLPAAAGPRAGDTAPDDEHSTRPRVVYDPTTHTVLVDIESDCGWSDFTGEVLTHQVELVPAGAGDTAPEHPWLERYQQALNDLSKQLAEREIEVDRLRSDAAALRDAGNDLAADVLAMLTGPVPEPGDWWSRLAPRVDAWRSAAGAPTTGGGDT